MSSFVFTHRFTVRSAQDDWIGDERAASRYAKSTKPSSRIILSGVIDYLKYRYSSHPSLYAYFARVVPGIPSVDSRDKSLLPPS